MKSIILGLTLCLVYACNHNSKTIKISTLKDTCYHLLDTVTNKRIEASRWLMILENTLTDTVVLGLGVLPPKYVGKFSYLKVDEKTNDIIYYEDGDDKNWPKTKTICIDLYKNRPVMGSLIVQYFY